MFKESDNLLESIDYSVSQANNYKGTIGLEKESLRVFESCVSLKSHKDLLGSPLFNKYITTDFADAQLELVTPPFSNNTHLVQFLDNLQHYVIHNIDEEYLWPFSIPAKTKNGSEITIANFGKSNKAYFKEIYRKGLAKRYGSTMQSISGVHFNYSFDSSFWKSLKLNPNESDTKELKSKVYFRTLRNIQRYNWLILYLFGCSPIIGNDLVSKEYEFIKINNDEYYLPYATSIRMSSMGYQNISQSNLFISLNDINTYLKDL
jgi:glutamate--cysteine ligase